MSLADTITQLGNSIINLATGKADAIETELSTELENLIARLDSYADGTGGGLQ